MQASAEDRQQTEPPPPRTRKSRRLRLALWIAGALVVLVGLYAALGFWVVPRIIRSQVVAQVEERYHRNASIGEVRFNPFTLELEANAFSLPDADGKLMVAFDRLAVNSSVASIWRRGVVFNEISLDAPKVRLVRRADGRINIQDLVPPPSGKPLPRVMIDHLEVSRGRAEVVDLQRKTPYAKTFMPIGFSLNDFSTVKDGAAYVLNAVSEQGEGLAWRGTFGLQPLASQGTFALTKIKVPALWELAGDVVPFSVTGGELNLKGGYRFASAGEKLTLTTDVDDLRLTDLGLRAAGADADWVVLPAVVVSKVHVDVPAQSVSVGGIEATNPSVTAWTEADGGINLARYAPAQAPAATTVKTAAPAKPWTVDLQALRVRGAKIAFEERSTGTPVKLIATPLDVTITGLALPLVKPVTVEATTGLEGGGQLAAKGMVTLDKVSAQLDVRAADIDLVRFQPYIDGSAALILLSGKLFANGHVNYASNGAVKYDGGLRIDALHTVDKALKEDFVNWRSLRAEGLSVNTQPFAVKIREIVAQEPYARVVVGPNYVMNVAGVLDPKGAATAAAVAAAPKPKAVKAKFSLFKSKRRAPPPQPKAEAPQREALPVEIALVRVEKGKMDFSDLSIEPRFVAGIQELNGAIKGLSGRQDARAVVDMTGQVDRFSPVKIGGTVNYFAARSYTDVTMDFKNMELTTFSPYSGKFAGYRINKGKLDVNLHYNIDDQKLDANHRVVIDQLELGDRVDSADAVKLPVKLIIALLKDRRGVIDLPIGVAGTLDDPKFKIWPVIWKVVGDLMVKIATSPFDMLASLGTGGPEMQFIDFAPGAGALDDADHQKLTALGKALTERPALNLEIPMPVSPAQDKAALLEARFQAQIAASGSEAALTDPKARQAILEALYLKEFAAKPELPKPPEGDKKADMGPASIVWLEEKLRAKIVVTDQDLQQLGRTRAEAVQGVILGEGQIDPARVFVTVQPPLDAATGPVRMTLSLS